MKRLVKLSSLLLLFAFVLFSCNKDDSAEPTKDYEELSFDADEVLNKIPEGLKNASDEKAQDCVDWIESALDMSSFMDNMTPPSDAQVVSMKSTTSEVVYTWSWAYGGQTVTMFWTYRDDATKNYWTLQIQIDGGIKYDYVDAWEFKDGSRGEMLYNFNWVCAYSNESSQDCYDIYWRYTWEKTAAGGYNFSFYYDSYDTEYTYYLRYDISINADGSGTIDYYLYDALFYHMEWDVLGNGSWTYYYDGVLNTSGSWRV
jgi:hypothetical protein